MHNFISKVLLTFFADVVSPCLLKGYLITPPEELEKFAQRIKLQVSAHKRNRSWTKFRETLPEVLAAIFAVWSVSSSASFYASTKNKNSILRPHPVQVFSIFRILEIDAPAGYLEKAKVFFLGDQLNGHLIQIGTGEGKSIILGILSTILALVGFRISCVCYSQYLSARDYHSFKDLFLRFGVAEDIKYSTLAQMAGEFINEEGDIREYTKAFIEGGRAKTTKVSKQDRILLIDEVDIFFSRDFYGATYNPSVSIKDTNVAAILEFIWKNRASVNLAQVKATEAYQQLLAKYPRISRIIETSIIRMMDQSKNFNDPMYSRTNECGHVVLGYSEGGTINPAIQHGYKTSFAYLHERDGGFVTNETAQQHLGLTVNCGQFSYAEVPKHFACILGVTGTLSTLGEFETSVKNEEYHITKSTFTPSIYGDSQLVWKEKNDVLVESDRAQYFRKILDNILEKKGYGQAVLVFFEDETKMNEYSTSDYCKGLTINKIAEAAENLDFYVKKSTLTGAVSFLPRVFGRGVDFVCYDDIVEKAGGIHVIQTFLSEDISEEIQIRGRTARQGKKGSFSLVLNQEDLIKQFSLTASIIEDQKKSTNLYEFLSKTRVAQFNKKSSDRRGIIDRSYQLHSESLVFRTNLVSNINEKDIIAYLEKQNPGIKLKSRTICISDATGSMSSVWANAQKHIHKFLVSNLETEKIAKKLNSIGCLLRRYH